MESLRESDRGVGPRLGGGLGHPRDRGFPANHGRSGSTRDREGGLQRLVRPCDGARKLRGETPGEGDRENLGSDQPPGFLRTRKNPPQPRQRGFLPQAQHAGKDPFHRSHRDGIDEPLHGGARCDAAGAAPEVRRARPSGG